MANSTHRVTAGLVFLGTRSFDIVRIGNRISMTLDWLDEQTTSLRILSDCAANLHSERFVLRIEIKQDYKVATLEQRAPQFLALSLTPTDPEAPIESRLDLSVMAHVLRSLHATLAPDYVQWVHPLAVLSHAEFLDAVTAQEDDIADQEPQATVTLHPAVQAARNRLPDIEATHHALQARLSVERAGDPDAHVTGALRAMFRETSDSSDTAPSPQDAIREKTAPLRLTVWMMTITLALFALPVAAALAVFNLLRGENLRLASQITALTGFFISLQVTGATAQALQTVQGLLG